VGYLFVNKGILPLRFSRVVTNLSSHFLYLVNHGKVTFGVNAEDGYLFYADLRKEVLFRMMRLVEQKSQIETLDVYHYGLLLFYHVVSVIPIEVQIPILLEPFVGLLFEGQKVQDIHL
jgi:hypothetical protein